MASKEKFKKNGGSSPLRRKDKRVGEQVGAKDEIVIGVPLELKMSNGKEARPRGAKRNPAKTPAESKDVQKANELMLRAWERIYAKRDKFGKLA